MASPKPTLLLIVLLLLGCQKSATVEKTKDKGEDKEVVGHILPPPQVKLTIDFADKRAPIDFHMGWKPGLTAFDVLLEADRVKKVALVYTGSGETAFVKSIGGTEGGAGGNKWWLFYVNGKMGKVGSGVYELKKADKVVWTLGDYE